MAEYIADYLFPEEHEPTNAEAAEMLVYFFGMYSERVGGPDTRFAKAVAKAIVALGERRGE